MARHSRLQREVLGLYRQFLRACRGKPGFLPRVQAEFRRAARIPRTDVLLIQYLLRRGQRQLAQLREGHATRMGVFVPGEKGQQQQGEDEERAPS
ncbi:succinate dehydrogenase assembly factor 1, mitochondrial [Erythrolamprus reginae]|uniref:succinate dehydrogenase assembly factor 1, mitochondrial n=1 Tax=Erythrolamprus reginae TaxID=121349 RepID=UPI00396CF921